MGKLGCKVPCSVTVQPLRAASRRYLTRGVLVQVSERCVRDDGAPFTEDSRQRVKC